MNETTLGKLVEVSGVRDAVHVATMSVVAIQPLRPGDHVGILREGEAGLSINPIGIVDPFLSETVKKGQVFQLCLYPRSTVNLRHSWQHPMLDNVQQKSPSQAFAKIKEEFAKLPSKVVPTNLEIPKYEPPVVDSSEEEEEELAQKKTYDASDIEAAWDHMRSFASQCEISLQDVMDYADQKYRGEHVLHICRGFTEPDITQEMRKFWECYCAIRNVTMPEGFDLDDTFVSCSC